MGVTHRVSVPELKAMRDLAHRAARGDCLLGVSERKGEGCARAIRPGASAGFLECLSKAQELVQATLGDVAEQVELPVDGCGCRLAPAPALFLDLTLQWAAPPEGRVCDRVQSERSDGVGLLGRQALKVVVLLTQQTKIAP